MRLRNRHMARKNSAGHGLGLSGCVVLLETIGGRIKARQNTPHGLIIEITLPITNEMLQEANATLH